MKIDPHPRVVAKLAPHNSKRTRYTFIGIRGLQLDCIPDDTPLGNRVWRVRYYVGQAEKIATLGTFNEGDREGYLSLSQANAKAAEYRRSAKIDKRDPAHAAMTFNALFVQWMNSHAKPNKKSWEA